MASRESEAPHPKMYMRQTITRRGGKSYRYWKLVESVRTAGGIKQRVVAHLGNLSELSGKQWEILAARLGLSGEAERLKQRVGSGRRGPGRPPKILALEPPEPGEPVISVRLGEVSWEDPKEFGDVYAGLEMWKRVGLGDLIEEKVGRGSGWLPMDRVVALNVVARLVAPASELKTARWWKTTGLPELLGIKPDAVNEDHLYRCLDLVWPHKAAIEKHLQREGTQLFGQQYQMFLYDISSTYFEGRAAAVGKARRGYSRDHRPDCNQICFGVVVTGEGWPTGYETHEGNIRDHQTLPGLLKKFEERFGKPNAVGPDQEPDRVLVMDRGLLTQGNLTLLRESHYGYMLAEKRAKGAKWYWDRGKEDAWVVIRKDADDRPEVEVQEIGTDGPDRLVLVRSAGCRQKERGIHERVLRRLTQDLEAMAKTLSSGRLKDTNKIQQRLGRLQERHASLWKWVRVEVETAESGLSTLRWEIQQQIDEAMRQAEGVYVLRTNLPKRSAEHLWTDYIWLTVVESVFRTLKHDLHIRPIFHRKGDRVEAHVLFSFLAYVLYWMLEREHRSRGGKLTGRRLLEALRQIKLGTIVLKTTGGVQLRLKRVSTPSREIAEVLRTLDLRLPWTRAAPGKLNLNRTR